MTIKTLCWTFEVNAHIFLDYIYILKKKKKGISQSNAWRWQTDAVDGVLSVLKASDLHAVHSWRDLKETSLSPVSLARNMSHLQVCVQSYASADSIYFTLKSGNLLYMRAV